VAPLLKLANNIKTSLEPNGKLDYFKPLRLYKYSSEYYEKVGGYAEALRYTHLAQMLQDSLNRRNDAQKLSQMQLRYEVEKYANHVKAIESEKQLQKYLRNAIILILLLVLGLVYVNHQRLRHKHREQESELETAKKNLLGKPIIFGICRSLLKIFDKKMKSSMLLTTSMSISKNLFRLPFLLTKVGQTSSVCLKSTPRLYAVCQRKIP
jgi:hypothetical protein